MYNQMFENICHDSMPYIMTWTLLADIPCFTVASFCIPGMGWLRWEGKRISWYLWSWTHFCKSTLMQRAVITRELKDPGDCQSAVTSSASAGLEPGSDLRTTKVAGICANYQHSVSIPI